MGTDIRSIAQRRDKNGKWINVTGPFFDKVNAFNPKAEPFRWRNYMVFAVLAGIRNQQHIQPISEPRGFPADFDAGEWRRSIDREISPGDHSYSWVSLDELLSYDYDRVLDGPSYSAALSIRTWINWGGGGFFHDLDVLKEIGAERVVFMFND